MIISRQGLEQERELQLSSTIGESQHAARTSRVHCPDQDLMCTMHTWDSSQTCILSFRKSTQPACNACQKGTCHWCEMLTKWTMVEGRRLGPCWDNACLHHHNARLQTDGRHSNNSGQKRSVITKRCKGTLMNTYQPRDSSNAQGQTWLRAFNAAEYCSRVC